MPADLTIFAANYLVYIEAVVAVAAVAMTMYRWPLRMMLHWAIASAITAVVAEVLAHVAGAVYDDPRPFAAGHFRPLIPHASDNGFPSDHALLAAALLVGVIFARSWLVVPLVAVLAVLMDWARVGAGIHHPVDVIAGTLFVAIGAAVAVLVTPTVVARIVPHVREEFSFAQRDVSNSWRR